MKSLSSHDQFGNRVIVQMSINKHLHLASAYMQRTDAGVMMHCCLSTQLLPANEYQDLT